MVKKDAMVNGVYVGKVESSRLNNKVIKITGIELSKYNKDFLAKDMKIKETKVYEFCEEGLDIEIDLADYEQIHNEFRIMRSNLRRLVIKNSNVNIKIFGNTIEYLEVTNSKIVYVENSTIENIVTDKVHLKIGDTTLFSPTRVKSIVMKSAVEFHTQCKINRTKIDRLECIDINEIGLVGCEIKSLEVYSSNEECRFNMVNTLVGEVNIKADYLSLGIGNYRDGTDWEGNKITVDANKISIMDCFTKSKLQLNGDIDYSKYIDGGKLLQQQIYASIITKLGLRDLSKFKESHIVFLGGNTLDIDKLGDACIYSEENNNTLIIRDSIYMVDNIYTIKSFGDKNKIYTNYGTQAYYFLLTNGCKFELLDKVPDSILNKENKLRMLYGSLENRLLKLQGNKIDLVNNHVAFTVKNKFSKQQTVDIPDICCRQIGLLDKFQSVDTIYKSFDEFGRAMDILTLSNIQDIKIMTYKHKSINNLWALVMSKKALILKAVVFNMNNSVSLDSVKYNDGYSIAFADAIADNVDSVDKTTIKFKYLTKYNYEDVMEIRDSILKLIETKGIKYGTDKLLLCSKGYLRFRAVIRPHIGVTYISSGLFTGKNIKLLSREDFGLPA